MRIVAALLDRVAPSLTPKEDTLDLIRELRAGGHPLYFLSNMASTSIAYLERTQDFWPLFDGGIVSCRVSLLKPEAAMFERLLTQYTRCTPATRSSSTTCRRTSMPRRRSA